MNALARIWKDGRPVEIVLALVVVAGLVEAMRSLMVNGYLPQPFFFEPGDIWMDWFNTAYWARDKGTFDSWRTVYPPLSFVFLRLVGFDQCYEFTEGTPARDCDWVGVIVLHAIFVLNIFLCAKVFLKIDRRTALMRSFVVAAGLPMLDALERGNLMMIAFTCFLLAYGPLVRSAWVRWIAAGLAVNFKVYLISAIFPYLIRRRWRWFEGAMLATIGVYLATFAILGRGTPMEIYENITSFAGGGTANSFLDVWYPVTYQPVMALLTSWVFPVTSYVGSPVADFFTAFLPGVLLIVQLSIMAASGAAWVRPEAVPTHRLVNLAVCFALISSEAGGYTQVVIIFMTMFERWRGIGARWAIIACYVLCIPGDIYLAPVTPWLRNGFLDGPPSFYYYWLTAGPFLRPGIILSIPLALSLVTVFDVWRDIRTQGWRDRRRFRLDLPLLLGGGRAVPAGEARA